MKNQQAVLGVGCDVEHGKARVARLTLAFVSWALKLCLLGPSPLVGGCKPGW